MKSAILAVLFLLAGCGGSDEEPDVQAASASASAPDKGIKLPNCQAKPEMCW